MNEKMNKIIKKGLEIVGTTMNQRACPIILYQPTSYQKGENKELRNKCKK